MERDKYVKPIPGEDGYECNSCRSSYNRNHPGTCNDFLKEQEEIEAKERRRISDDNN
tara:strand:+ start:55 stop:225 length:171 start_codon:yes stop_codon:yes gene_type:complete